MNQELMTLDFWQDTVIYEGKTFPIGTLACDALNVPADTISKMNEQCEKINLLLGAMNAKQDASALFPMVREAALAMLDILSKTPPFSYMDVPKHRERIERVFTTDCALSHLECVQKANSGTMQLEDLVKYEDAVLLERYTAVFGHLAFSLGEYQKAMLDFAEKSDSNEADRTAEGFAKMFGSYFPPEFSITEGNAWMSVSNQSVQYVSTIRPGEDVAKLVKRMHYVSFVGMFRSDLFEGLCVGHAPKKCKICGKWFLQAFGIHSYSLSIAGGIILFLISINLVFSTDTNGGEPKNDPKDEPFIVPLAIPLVAGPAALSMVLILAAQHSKMVTLGAVICASIINMAILMCSFPLSKLLGQRGLTAIERLTGMILILMSVDMVLGGIAEFVKL